MSKDRNDKRKQIPNQKPQQIPKKPIPLDPRLIHTVKKGDDNTKDVTAEFPMQENRLPVMGNAHALVIGIADYQNINSLPDTVIRDAQDIYNLLIDPQYCAYPPGNVQLLLNGHATQVAVRQALASLAACTNHNSIVFLYVSSHGGRIESGAHQGEYLFPVDVISDTNQQIAETAISGTEFSTMLSAIPARKMVVIFDCCHASGIGQLKGTGISVFKEGLSDHYYESLQAGHGRAIIASSRADEYSHILPAARNSLFTQHLLAGLEGGVLSDDGLIRIFNLFEYLQPLVTRNEPQQHPCFKSDLEENFPIAIYVGGKKGHIPTDGQGFLYDAYISYADKEPDASWVWKDLVPRLEDAGLHIAVSGDVEEPGVDRVVGIERGIRQSRRTIVVLSPFYLNDHVVAFENILGQTLGLQEGTYRLLPVKIAQVDPKQLPLRLSMLTTLDLIHPYRAEREFGRLVRALQGPLPS